MTRYEEVRELVKNDALRIKDIAQQTGYDKGHVSRLRKDLRLQKVIADAVAAEREACAKVCEELRDDWWRGLGRYEFMGEGADYCADEIRARGGK